MICTNGILLLRTSRKKKYWYFRDAPTKLAPRNGQSWISYISALASARCQQSRPMVVIVGAVNMASDIYLALIPLPAVCFLQLQLRRRIGISPRFLTGSMSDFLVWNNGLEK